jgi:hypothetical protein
MDTAARTDPPDDGRAGVDDDDLPETVPLARDERQVRRAHLLRLLAHGLLGAFVVAGLVGLLGGPTRSSVDAGAGTRLTVEYPPVVRAGTGTPYVVTIERDGGFDGPVVVELTTSWPERLDFQSFYPTPSAETARPGWVRYELDPPDGEVLVWTFDVRTNPQQLLVRGRHAVRVLDGSGRPVAEVQHVTWAVP